MTDDERLDRIRLAAVDRLVKRGAGIAICITLDADGCPTYSAAFPEGSVFDVCALLDVVRTNIINNMPAHTTDGIAIPPQSAMLN